MKKVWLVALGLLCANAVGYAETGPAARLSRLESSWGRGLGHASWQQLEKLEADPGRATWPKALQIRFCLQRARMTVIRRTDLAGRNLDAALALCDSPLERSRVLAIRCDLLKDRDALHQAIVAYQASGMTDPLLEATLAFDAGEMAVVSRDPDDSEALHFLHAARIDESAGQWLAATRAWAGLARFQSRRGSIPESTLRQAARCARQAHDPRAWVILALDSDVVRRGLIARIEQSIGQMKQAEHAQKATVLFCGAWGSHSNRLEAARAEAAKSGDADLEMEILEREFHMPAISDDLRQSIYNRAVVLCEHLDPEHPSPPDSSRGAQRSL